MFYCKLLKVNGDLCG